MKAMILAAGLGTRLRPLTDDRPKALVAFKGMAMVERIIRNLASAGIHQVIVNVHHFAGQVIDFLDQLDVPGTRITVSDEREMLQDTGGALLHARDFLAGEDDFLVHNVDVLTDLDIPALIRAHKGREALATLAVKKRSTSRSLLFDEQGFLCGWRHNMTGETRIVRRSKGSLVEYGNSCVQVIRGELFRHYPENQILNLTDMYLDLAANHRIQPFIHNEDFWFDLGSYENYLKADKEIF